MAALLDAVPAASTTAIFISYAADDPDWPADRVEALAQALLKAGAAVHLDIWAERELGRLGSDAEWREWMRMALDTSRHMLCLASDLYTRLCERSLDEPQRGRGVAFESSQLDDWLYNRKQRNDGRIWVCLAGQAPVPRFLRGQAPVYPAPDKLGELVEHLSSEN